MRNLKILIALCVALVMVPSCAVFKPGTNPSITYEASVFLSFNDVWQVTRNAYLGFKIRQAQGGISSADAADVDKAWDTFRSGFLIALDVAQKDKSQFTPPAVRVLANDVLDLIAAAL